MPTDAEFSTLDGVVDPLSHLERDTQLILS